MTRLGLHRRRTIPQIIPEHTSADESEQVEIVSFDGSTSKRPDFSTSPASVSLGSQQSTKSRFLKALRRRKKSKDLGISKKRKARRRWRIAASAPIDVDSNGCSSDSGNQLPTPMSVPISVSTPMEGSCERNHEKDNCSVLSIESQESLLDAWSTDDEESIDEECHGLERMSKYFEIRDRIFDRITAQKRGSYRAMLREHELASREQFMRRHGLGLSSVDSNAERQPLVEGSLVRYRIVNHLIFEGHHTAGGMWAVLFCCLGSATFYYGFEVLISKTINFGVSHGVSSNICNIILIATSLLLMRLNGYMWEFINHESYRLVKFDMHNRLQLGYFDARIMKWLSSPRLATLNAFISVCAFYGVYSGVLYFYFELLGGCEDSLWQWYARKEQEVALFLQEPVVGKPQFCEAIRSMEQPWYEKGLAYYACTDPDVTFLYFGFHALCLVLASGAMASTGRNILKLSL